MLIEENTEKHNILKYQSYHPKISINSLEYFLLGLCIHVHAHAYMCVHRNA